MAVKILVTGGTIDDLEYASPEDAPKVHKSLIRKLLEQSRVTAKYNIEELMHKDSRHITESDRKCIAEACRKSKENAIVITHGTLTMAPTAKYLSKEHMQKTIVLVGAAIPANKPHSDALFNIGAAFTAAQILAHGVYICMNGQVFLGENVKKNLSKGIFEKETQ